MVNLVDKSSINSRLDLFPDHARRRALFYVEALTGLRGFAAFWVFVYHAWVAATPRHISIEVGSFSVLLTPFFSIGWAGGDIFYPLSGFLLTVPFAKAALEQKEKPKLSTYFLRRILRIFPAYYAQLGILLSFAWLGVYGEVPGIGNLFAHLLMAHNVSFQYFLSMNGVWWTLPVEFSFYLILPLLIIFLRRHHWLILLLGAIGFTILYRYLMFQQISGEAVPYKVWMMEQLPGRIDQFVIGMLTAYFFVRYRLMETARPGWGYRVIPTLSFVSGIVGMIVFIYLIHYNVQTYWEGNFLLFIWHGCVGIFVSLIIYGIAENCSVGRFLFGNRIILAMGVISYSFYLWHQLAITWLMKWDYFINFKGYLFPVLFIISLFVSLGIAAASYFTFERPFLILRLRKT